MTPKAEWTKTRRQLVVSYRLKALLCLLIAGVSCMGGLGLGLIEKFGNWGIPAGCILYVVTLAGVAGGLGQHFVFWNKASSLSESHEATEKLRNAIENKESFALYIRPFASERDEDHPPWAPYTEGVAEDIMNQKLDGNAALRVLPVIRKQLPIFALLNPNGTSTPAALCVDALEEDWPNLFRDASAAARLIIVGSGEGEDGTGFKFEIDHICGEKYLGKTLTLHNMPSNLLTIYPSLKAARWSVDAPGRDFEMPPDMLELARAIAPPSHANTGGL